MASLRLTTRGLLRMRTAAAARPLSSHAMAAEEARPAVTMLDEEEVMFQDSARRFATEVIQPHAAAMDKEATMRKDILQGMFDNGLLGVEVDQEHGGAGGSFMSSCLVVEEIAKIDGSVAVLCDIQNTLCNNLLKFWASKELQDEWLPRVATDTIASFCLSEEGSGSDAFAMKTSAKLSADGSEYVLNGQKMWISNAEHAGVFFVFANADESKGYKGITCFVVPKDTEGLSLGAPEDKLGLRASSTCSVFLNDVRVPATSVLGEVGQGYKYAIEILNEGRIGIGAQMVGLAQGCFDSTMPYVMERKQFGKSIATFQAMEHQYANVAMEIECARLLTYNAARLKMAGKPFVKEGAMAKLYSSRVAEKTASQCIEWLGGVGFTKAFPAEKCYRDCKVGAIYEGTSNIQLSTIAKFIRSDFD